MNRGNEPKSEELLQTGKRLLPGAMQTARHVARRMTVDTRLKRLEQARKKLRLSDIEEVKELAIDFYLSLVERRPDDSAPRISVTVEGGRQRLCVE